MNLTSPTDRRQFLKLVGTGSLGLALPSGGVAQRRPLGAAAAGEAAVAAEIDLVAGFAHVPILPGPATRVAQFTAGVVAGDPGALRPSASYLGPTIEVESGQSIRVRFRNRIDGPSIVHWHGLH
ncbi:MAG: multicopper oxidase domain-containing protein, partial [Thermoanaerobaculia bacterium]|nr:multicopper oxidase domain-containing protein [Thermoanaerobaculia bacterium]